VKALKFRAKIKESFVTHEIMPYISFYLCKKIVLHRRKENPKYTLINTQEGNLKEVTITKRKKKERKLTQIMIS